MRRFDHEFRHLVKLDLTIDFWQDAVTECIDHEPGPDHAPPRLSLRPLVRSPVSERVDALSAVSRERGMSAHTPGPWHVVPEGPDSDLRVAVGAGEAIAHVTVMHSEDVA